MTEAGFGVGVIGAGRFAAFLLAAAATVPQLSIRAIADPDLARARRLAAEHDAVVLPDPADLLGDDRIDAVIIATPPATHAALSLAALAAGRHVFCEKPVALTARDAAAVRAAVAASGCAYVVDHVLRYNSLLAALCRLRAQELLGPVRRFAFENDAADENLPAGHWFWDDAISGGILLEHGVHFFDAASMLIGAPPQRVQAVAARRPDGRTDTVVATAVHADGALASYAHGFSHAHRAERQLWRLDFGLAEARVHGWIPLCADLDVWTDTAGVDRFQQLPDNIGQLLEVPGVRPSGAERITVQTCRHAAPGSSAPHHLTVRIALGEAGAKSRVYQEGVRAALLDLAHCARTGATPRADIDAGCAAVAVAGAATAALPDGCTHAVPSPEAP